MMWTPPVSVEVCPNVSCDLDALKTLSVRFVSVTWHQSGRRDDDATVDDGIDALDVAALLPHSDVLAHFPACRLQDENRTRTVLGNFRSAGIRQLLVLRGDRPPIKEGPNVENRKERFPYAIDLVRFVREEMGDQFRIGVAGYPEKHPESSTSEQDLLHLRRKVEAGADFIITQVIFEYATLKTWIDTCRRNESASLRNVPIIPGLFLFSSYDQLQAMVKIASLRLPENVSRTVYSLRDDQHALQNYSVRLVSDLAKEILQTRAAESVHLFSMNNLQLVKRVYRELGFECDNKPPEWLSAIAGDA